MTKNEPVLNKAMTTLEFLSQDEEACRLYKDRQKYLHDQDISIIAKASGLSESEIIALKNETS
ncbi:hypothetical protein ACE5LO_18095 [Paenibacillus medicaginis]|uniref:Uncharacterized protein n=1 Tax=Paenibacillus medicaginis TaxID=1470560 RepID=A0ABV5C452_9BACL